MLSERVARRIERLLEQADEAIERRDWPLARECVQAVLALDPDSRDAHTYLAAADRALDLGAQVTGAASPESKRSESPPSSVPPAGVPQPQEKGPARRPASAEAVPQALATARQGPASSTPDPQPSTHAENPIYRRVFVAREAELRDLEAAFNAALSGRGTLAMVIGEPGIGKTALCEQLATYVGVRGGHTLVGHCYEEGSLTLPYLPFVEALGSYVLAREPDRLRQELGSGAADVARIVSEVGEKLAVEPRAAGDPDDDRWRLYQAVTGFVRNAATVQPLLIVLEDLHWADRGTLDFLVHLARNLEGAQLLLVGTYRGVEVDRAHPLSGALGELRRAGSFARLNLRGLTAGEVQRMIATLQGDDVSWSFAEAVHRQTEGNPLFVQEVLRYLFEEGLITRTAGHGGQTSETPPEMRIPEGLRDVVGKRLSRLGASCNRLLSVAAVIGRDFDLGILERVAETGEQAIVAALEEAVRAGVLDERTRPGQIRYRFAHAFFRQTLYEELLAPRRLRLHQHVARALEAEYGARPDEHAAELAEHYAQSTDRSDLEKAVAYCRMAAVRAVAVYAYAEAARLLEQALGVQDVLDPDDHRTRCELLLMLAEALGPAGDLQRAADEIAEEAFRLAEALADTELASAATRVGFVSLLRYGGTRERVGAAGQRWAERADRYAPPGSPARVYADLALGSVARRRARGMGGVDESWQHHRRALVAARALGDPELLFQCATHMLNGVRLGQWDEALSLARELAAIPRHGISWWTAADALDALGDVFLAWGERDRAEQLWREVSDLAERTRDPTIVANVRARDITVATLDGRLEAALEAADQLRILADEAGISPRGRQFSVGNGLRAHFYLGRAPDALEDLRGLSDELGEPRLGLGLAEAGFTSEAQEILDLYAQRWQGRPPSIQIATAAVQQILELGVLLEDGSVAALLVPVLAPIAAVICTRGIDLTCVARHLGAASALLGKHEQAQAYYQQALEVCQRVRFRPEVALTHLGIAQLALEQPHSQNLAQRERGLRRAEAMEHLGFAIDEFRAMKMQPALDRALLIQAGLQRHADRRARPDYPGGLSEREVEVLRLIAAGKSNRDIAAELVISLNTVARHVSNIFSKVGATNRVEAASFASRHGLA